MIHWKALRFKNPIGLLSLFIHPRQWIPIHSCLLLLWVLGATGCTEKHSPPTPKLDSGIIAAEPPPSLEPPRRLKVALVASAPDYFVYRGRPRGFLFDLSNILARRWQRRLQVEIARDELEALQWLEAGRVDLAAVGVPLAKFERSELLAGPAMEHSDSVLVTLKSGPTDTIAALQRSAAAEDLVSKCVPPCQQRLIPRPMSTWGLLKGFQSGKIKVQGVLAPRRYAEAFVGMYPQLHLREGWGPSRPVSWWLNRRDQDLLPDLEGFLDAFQSKQLYPVLRNRYYDQNHASFSFS